MDKKENTWMLQEISFKKVTFGGTNEYNATISFTDKNFQTLRFNIPKERSDAFLELMRETIVAEAKELSASLILSIESNEQ